MYIKSCTLEKVNYVARLVFERNCSLSMRCKPFQLNESILNIEKFYQMLIDKDSNDLLLQYEGDKLVGVTGISWIAEDKYLSVVGGIFVDGDYATISNHFLDHLEEKFEGYDLYVNLPKENSTLEDFLNMNDFKLLEEAEMYSLYSFAGFSINKHISKLDSGNKAEIYEHLNEIITSETYWNMDRVDKNPEKFIILGYYDKVLEGTIYAQIYRDNTVEVFGINTQNQFALRGMLESLAYICNEIDASKLIHYTWDIDEINMVKSLGYEYFDSNKCYLKSLVIGN